MPKSAKNSAPKGAALDDLPFEQALEKLELIVQAMDDDDLPLETMLGRYEEGMKLVEACQGKLAAAEIRIRKLERDGEGQVRARPMELTADREQDNEDESIS